MITVVVNPAKNADGEFLIVHDNVGRVIPYRQEGTRIQKTTLISRAIKSGDLVLVENKPAKEEKKIQAESIDKEK